MKKEVLKASIKKPMTLVPMAIGLTSFTAIVIFGSGTLLFSVGIICISLAVVSFFYHFIFRRQKLTTIYLSTLEQQIINQKKKELRLLKRKLRSSKFEEDISFYGQQAYEQFEQIEEKYKNYLKILADKFNLNELTYKRYFDVGSKVYQSLIEHMRKISIMLESANAVDTDYVQNRIKLILEYENRSPDDEFELLSLKDRLGIKQSQLEEIKNILKMNEVGLTKMDSTTNALAMITTSHGASNQDIDQLLWQLEQLANSASKYNIK